MYGQINFDLDLVDRIEWIYKPYEPEEDEYETEEERLELIRDNSTFDLECYDGEFYQHLGWLDDQTLEDIDDNFGEETAKEIQVQLNRGKTRGYVDDIISTQNSTVDLNDPEAVNGLAKKYFQTIDEYYKNTRGYILTDGSILLFGDNLDHLTINRLGDITIGKFVSLGNIRIGYASIYLEKCPTNAQLYQLRNMLSQYSNETIYIDVVKYTGQGSYSNEVFSMQYSDYNPQFVLNQLLRYFRDGIKPDAALNENKKTKKIHLKESQLRKIIRESIEEIMVYHGSRNYFDQFQLYYCGENLEPQYGYGIYLSSNKDVAENYLYDDIEEKNNGVLYSVEIPDDDGYCYITYNKRITNEQYQQIVMSLTDDEKKNCGINQNMCGIQVYNALSNILDNGDEGASEYLALCGIFGMKYIDNDDNMTLNYVMFDETVIQIKNKEIVN